MERLPEEDINAISTYYEKRNPMNHFTIVRMWLSRQDFRELAAQQGWTLKASKFGNIPEQKTISAYKDGVEMAMHCYAKQNRYELFLYSNRQQEAQSCSES